MSLTDDARPSFRSVHSVRDLAEAGADTSLGALPEWNLADLYPGMDAPEL